ncbi:MAG: hypothetical protein LBP85_04090 [Prevotellaceae bacterium]|nr:hypothetical protein [Prevotellaceae bacterium]
MKKTTYSVDMPVFTLSDNIHYWTGRIKHTKTDKYGCRFYKNKISLTPAYGLYSGTFGKLPECSV